ncbi:MAG: helix-turn-helix transcriptional regulator [Arcobacteraceae bacterium]|nr:helix-turn-helix transcriptional regulator [Arcobacteraceae bacterium]
MKNCHSELDSESLLYLIVPVLFFQKLGTTQAVISRIENGSVNIGIDFLQKIANTFNKKIDIKVA